MEAILILINIILIIVLLITISTQNKTSESITRTTKIMQDMIIEIDSKEKHRKITFNDSGDELFDAIKGEIKCND
mgnify:CR=1 FL=1|tara:strand:+ start:12107 stop:12331 length:225 start_codon:yes stop_codon:yes gene_type:complete